MGGAHSCNPSPSVRSLSLPVNSIFFSYSLVDPTCELFVLFISNFEQLDFMGGPLMDETKTKLFFISDLHWVSFMHFFLYHYYYYFHFISTISILIPRHLLWPKPLVAYRFHLPSMGPTDGYTCSLSNFKSIFIFELVDASCVQAGFLYSFVLTGGHIFIFINQQSVDQYFFQSPLPTPHHPTPTQPSGF